MQHPTPHRALITGASSGLGLEMARLLAQQGVALVITARRGEQLEALAAQLRAHVEVTVIAADLGQPQAAERLWAATTAGGPVDILINNAGFGYFRPFGAADLARDSELVTLNITSLIALTRMALAQSQAPRHILNVASIAGFQAVPNMALYAASKALVLNFSEALAVELAQSGSPTKITCLCPGGTQTEFHAQAGAGDYGTIANAAMMDAVTVARIGLAAMWKGKRVIIPGWFNKASCWLAQRAPRRLAAWAAAFVLGRPAPHALPPRQTISR